jgi:hypothetical protein
MIEQVLAGLVLVVCVLLLLRLTLNAPRRYRIDSALRRAGRWCVQLVKWPGQHRARKRAAAAQAEELIRRVRREVEREGNVIRPRQFRGSREPREPRKPH